MLGKLLIIVGVVTLIPVAIIIAHQTATPMGIPTPAGIGGTVKFQNGTVVPDGTPVTAKNLNTGETVTRTTENGYYAIGISARDGDIVEVMCIYNGMVAKNYTTIDLHKTTNWCNLTLGKIKEKKVDWWLLVIPFSLIGAGLYVEKKR